MNRVTQCKTQTGTPHSGFLIFVVLCLLTAESVGATNPLRWRWSNPRPHGANVVDMALPPLPVFVPAIQVGERGQIFYTSDFNLWFPVDVGTTNDLRAVTFFNFRIVIAGENGRVLYADTVDDFRFGTLIDGATTDWLESVTASSFLAVAVGDNGAVYTSTNGIHWKRQTSGTTTWLRGVTWGNGVFVAVGESGKIISSINGTNWVNRLSGTTEHFNRASYAPGRFTAVAENGRCHSSTNNGVNWFAELTGATNDLFQAMQHNGTRLVVGDNEVRLQDLGGLWSNELAQTNGPTVWTYYTAVHPPDNYFLMAGRTGLMEEGQRTGTNYGSFSWVPSDESVRNWLWDVTNPTNLYVAVGDRATVMTSGNGVNWKLEAVPEALTNSIFLGVGGTTKLLVAVGDRGSMMISPNIVTNYTVTNVFTNLFSTNYVISNVTGSMFGVVWYPIVSPTTNDLQGISASENSFVATGANGTILVSSDGTNWTLAPSLTNRFLSSVTTWPRGWVAVGDDGAILQSSDGVSWTIVSPVTTNWLYRVRYLDGKLIAVGQNGTVLTSSNGSNWTKQTSGTAKWLNDVEWIDNTFYVVGNSGTVLTSTNAINWSSIGTITKKNLYGAATDSGQLIAVGIEGVILRAQIVPNLMPIEILSYDRLTLPNSPDAGTLNLYLFGGKPDQRFTIDHRLALDTNSWVSGPQLEFFDGSSTLYYLESITTNPPPQEYYRATLVP
jgi:hypothetical protein